MNEPKTQSMAPITEPNTPTAHGAVVAELAELRREQSAMSARIQVIEDEIYGGPQGVGLRAQVRDELRGAMVSMRRDVLAELAKMEVSQAATLEHLAAIRQSMAALQRP